MKKSIKKLSLVICFILIISVCSACEKNPSTSENNTTTTTNSNADVNMDTTLGNETANSPSNDTNGNDNKNDQNSSSGNNSTVHDNSNEVTDAVSQPQKEDPNENRDSRLIGNWNASMNVPVNEAGATVVSNSSMVFRKDGTFAQNTSEAQAKQMIIDTYKIVFNCQSEAQLDNYIRTNKGTSLEGYVVMALAEMTDEDFYTKGKWQTEDNNTLYQTITVEGKEQTESVDYSVSADGNTITIYIDELVMTLTRA